MSDSRTNAGVDNVSVFRKMFKWEVDGERQIVLMTAGNLATTQTLVSLLDERTKTPEERSPDILSVPTMFQAARLVGKTLEELIVSEAKTGETSQSAFEATLILGGQIGDNEPRLFLIYPEGNFIEATDDTPFFQIGETKYGKPIIVRAFDPDMSFEDAVKLLMVSFDSTIKANISVDLPLDLHIQERGNLKSGRSQRVEHDNPYYRSISEGWGDALKKAFNSLPDFAFDENG